VNEVYSGGSGECMISVTNSVAVPGGHHRRRGRAWTNVDDRKSSCLRSGRTRCSESGKKAAGSVGFELGRAFNQLISLKLNRRWRSERCWLGLASFF